MKNGDIYNPTTLQKLDRITKFMINTKGVVPYQILSIAHPAVNSATVMQGAVQVRPVFYPGVPQTQEDAERVRFAVYANPNIRGIYVSHDDTAAVVNVGFWEEALDFQYLYDRMMELKHAEEDANHTIYITGFPWLYTSVLQYAYELPFVFGFTLLALAFLLYTYFRTWTGIWVPIFSGILSAVWGLALAALLGFNVDPLVLVIPIFLTARTLSHSVQSMDRYHEEYYRRKDKHQAIVESYSHLFPPAIASIFADGMALLVVAVGPIPLIQKVAIFASFWIVSMFISVVTLHPIILSYINPPHPPDPHAQEGPDRVGIGVATAILAVVVVAAIAASELRLLPSRWAVLAVCPIIAGTGSPTRSGSTLPSPSWSSTPVRGIGAGSVIVLTVALYVLLPMWGWTLKVGDMTPGCRTPVSRSPLQRRLPETEREIPRGQPAHCDRGQHEAGRHEERRPADRRRRNGRSHANGQRCQRYDHHRGHRQATRAAATRWRSEMGSRAGQSEGNRPGDLQFPAERRRELAEPVHGQQRSLRLGDHAVPRALA